MFFDPGINSGGLDAGCFIMFYEYVNVCYVPGMKSITVFKKPPSSSAPRGLFFFWGFLSQHFSHWRFARFGPKTPKGWFQGFKMVFFPCSYCWSKKSCTTWDVWNLINNGKIIILGGAGFQPSTVSLRHLTRMPWYFWIFVLVEYDSFLRNN